MRPEIALLLLGTLMIGGCDRQSQAPQQVNEGAVAPEAAPSPAAGEPAPANEVVKEEVIGTLDPSHKGEAAPAIWFESPSGSQITLASFKGKPVLLNLWATWCVPCVAEMPTLDALAVKLGDKVQVLAVSQDLDGDAKVAPFFQAHGFKRLQPYLDSRAALSGSMNLNLPTTILYDSQGREVWRMLGGMDWTGEEAAELVAQAN